MSLNFDFTAIADHETLCWLTDERGQRRPSPITEALIFHTMTVGMGSITERNIDEFILRVTATEALLGASLTAWPEDAEQPQPRPITAEEIRAHVGLRTNASSKTHTAWRRDIQAQATKSTTSPAAAA